VVTAAPEREIVRGTVTRWIAGRNEKMILLPHDDAAAARAAEDQRRLVLCDEIEALIVDVRDQHPDVHLSQLAPFLQEPQKTRLLELLEEAQDFVSYPLQPEEQP
jgi:hypothetical protein